MKTGQYILFIISNNCQPERSGDLRSSFSIINCQFRKWSAFPAQTPYHYAYNSPLTYRDPSGLAPEKEKEREELLDLNPDYLSGGYEFGIWNANEIERYNGMVNFWNDIFSGLDGTMSGVINWKDAFNTNYGGGSGGRTASVSKASNGSLDALGNYHSTLIITYSDGTVIYKPVMIACNAVVGDQETMMAQLVAETKMILDADISYFDDLIGGDYDILIETGSDIAEGYYSRNPAKAKGGRNEVASGLHTPNGKKSATFRIASELFGDGHEAHRYTSEDRSTFLWIFQTSHKPMFLEVWDSFAHEVGHELDLLKYGNAYSTMTTAQREQSTETRVNVLRGKVGKPKSIYP